MVQVSTVPLSSSAACFKSPCLIGSHKEAQIWNIMCRLLHSFWICILTFFIRGKFDFWFVTTPLIASSIIESVIDQNSGIPTASRLVFGLDQFPSDLYLLHTRLRPYVGAARTAVRGMHISGPINSPTEISPGGCFFPVQIVSEEIRK